MISATSVKSFCGDTMQALRDLLPAPTTGYQAGRKVIKRITKHLNKLSSDPQQLTALDDYYSNSRNFKFSRKPFPHPPNSLQQPHIIDKYIENITTTAYGGKVYHNADNKMVNDAIAQLIQDCGLSPVTFNLVLAYFARQGDPVKILELMQQQPHVHTQGHFNHWLYSLYAQRRFHPEQFQIKAALPILAAMGDENCVANGQTWNMAFLAMPSHNGMQAMYNEMTKRNIPFGQEATSVFTNYIISRRGVDAVAKHLHSTSIGQVTLPVVHAVIEAMLRTAKPANENVIEAFDFVNYWASNGLKPSKATLNIFLYHFSHRQHLDWMVGISEYFEQEYGVQMTSRSWEHMIHAASKMNESAAKYQMVGLLFKDAMKLALTDKAKTYLRLSYTLAKENGYKVVYPGQHVMPYLRHKLNWGRTLGPPDYINDDTAAKAAGAMGFTKSKPDISMLETPLCEVGIIEHRLWRGDSDDIYRDSS